MLDTVRITLQNVGEDALRHRTDGELWSFNTLEDGTLQNARLIHRLNASDDGKAYNGTVGLEYDFAHRYLNVSVSSVPAMLYGTSFETVKQDDLSKVGDALNAEVEPFLNADLNDGTFTRLDNSTLYAMKHEPSKYIALLDDLTRDKQYTLKKKYFQGETLELYNGRRTIGLYDKYAKNAKNKVEMQYLRSIESDKTNALRYEIQNKNAPAIRQAFGQDVTLKHLASEDFRRRLLQQRLNEFNKHFRFSTEERKATLEDFLNTSIFMKAKHKRTALDKTLWYLVIQKDFMTLKEVRKVMTASGYSRQAIYRRMKALEEVTSYDVERLNLYEELKSKVAYECKVA